MHKDLLQVKDACFENEDSSTLIELWDIGNEVEFDTTMGEEDDAEVDIRKQKHDCRI